MPFCAYCHRQGKLTCERTFPAGLRAPWFRPAAINLPGTGRRLPDLDPDTDDVCLACRDSELARLDHAIRLLLDRHHHVHGLHPRAFDFTCDYDLLSRWLLKIAYDTARAHNRDVIVLSRHKTWVRYGKDRPNPKFFKIFAEVVRPWSTPSHLQPPLVLRAEAEPDPRVKPAVGGTCRLISVHAFLFHLILFNPNSSAAERKLAERQIVEPVGRGNLTELQPDARTTRLRLSRRTVLDLALPATAALALA